MDQASITYYVFKLMDRDLTEKKIDMAMVKIIGKDWRKVKVETWIKRLKDKGYISEESSELTVDDLEALIMGSLKFDLIMKNDYPNH